MPSHQSLRERCNVPDRVCTDRKPSSKSDPKDRPSNGPNRPCVASSLSGGIQEVPRTPHGVHGPRQFIPYLYLFSPTAPGTIPAGPWTHTLRLLPPTKLRPAGSTDLITGNTGAGRPSGLDLHIPTAGFKDAPELHLASEHLLLARDFLALALPYYGSAHPPAYSASPSFSGWPKSSASATAAFTPISHLSLEGLAGAYPPPPPSQADPVRVLVLGPPRAVFAIALTYVAYASGCEVAQVMRGVLEGDADVQWWQLLGEDGKMMLGKKDMRMLERAAMQEM
ncbi:hypothetical protein C8R43DRAFT_1019646 [Mycena crocata]|nr:hypothetical protein C8R43DRAFT_1019646 [Mycena crocata]